MKVVLALALFGLASALDVDDASIDTKTRFQAWKEEHNKEYATDDEESNAYWTWRQNDHIVQEHNAQGLSYTLGHNEFSDMTNEEFTSKYVGSVLDNPTLNRERNFVTLDASAAPDSIDWVTKGAVTPIKNQGQCGSCWAFSTTGSVEGDYFIEQGKLLSFSEQDLVSCDHNGDQGCNGGLMDNAFEWIAENGICLESDYPYTSGSGTTGTCETTCTPAAKITGHKDVPQNDEDSLKAAAANQPVSVAIEADKSAFQLYKSGVFDDASCGTQLDHGVLVVGYGTEDSADYWKVKNSWGATWGMEGYILMARGKNMCGISLSASYPEGAAPTGGSSPSPSSSPAPSTGPSPSSEPAPSVSPSPSGPAPSTHYGDPKNGCLSDEQAIQIQGVTGDFCSPKCTGILKTKCPSDVPAGVTAEPECALKDTSDDKYCALICTPSSDDAQCGENASCKEVQAGVGLCTYDD